jgi:hypothetical protein
VNDFNPHGSNVPLSTNDVGMVTVPAAFKYVFTFLSNNTGLVVSFIITLYISGT